MKNRIAVLFLWFLAVYFLLYAQESERLTALVIGNGTYKGSPLRNPANDARDVSWKLTVLGFKVITLINATHQEMDDAVYEFGIELKEGGVGLFYYAGHGAQYQGVNYLIPVDSAVRSAPELPYKAVPAGL